MTGSHPDPVRMRRTGAAEREERAMRRWITIAAATATCMAVLPVPGAGAAEPTTVELVSGPGVPGSRDANTDISLDGGVTWQDAWIVQAHPLYSTLPGTSWLSDSTSGVHRQNQTTLFRREFRLPDGASDAGLRVCLHADNVATVRLNGVLVGAQLDGAYLQHFQDPAECFDAPPGALAETNELRFSVRDHGSVMGLDYRATLTYAERVDLPPALQLPAPITVEADSRDGMAVPFEVTASDDGAAPATVVCEPAPGSVFPVGTTTVGCTATDDGGLTSTGSFDVTVTYTNRPPSLTAPADVVVDTDSRDGTTVAFDLPAVTDDGLAASTVSCTPPPGAFFAVGTTTVTCTATDDEGLASAPVSFSVTVNGPVQRTCAALDAALTSTTLSATLRAAADGLQAAGYPQLATSLRSLATVVAPYDGRRLSVTLAAVVRSWLLRVDAELGCP